MTRIPKYGRGAAWITPQGIVYHCGLKSHALVFQQNYRGERIGPATIRDTLADVHRAVRATAWVRVLSPHFDVRRINAAVLRRIEQFLRDFWDIYGEGHERFWVEDADGHVVSLYAQSQKGRTP